MKYILQVVYRPEKRLPKRRRCVVVGEAPARKSGRAGCCDGATGHGGCGELDPQAALLAADAGARSGKMW